MTDIPLIHIDNRNKMTKQDYKIENCDIRGAYNHHIIAEIIYLKLFLPKNDKYYGELSFSQFDCEPIIGNPNWYLDQIPLIDIFICKYKEDIITQQLKLKNVLVLHNGTGTSIDDITKETVCDITVEEVTESIPNV